MSASSRRRAVPVVRLAVLASLVVVAAERVPTQSSPWGIHDLGALGGAQAFGESISDFGHSMVGRAQTTSGAFHAFIYDRRGITDLGTLGGAESTAYHAYCGWIAGQAQTASGQYRAFLLQDRAGAAMRDLGTLGGNWSAAYASECGTSVVGASRTSSGRLQAFRWTVATGTMEPLATPGWDGDSAANTLKGGYPVGYACTAGNAKCRAVRFSDDTVIELGSLGGNSVALGINYNETVIGTSYLADGTTKHAAFFSMGGTAVDLGTLGGRNSEAYGINERGDVVGTADTASGVAHAFFYRDGVMIDLNTLLPPDSGWVLQSAKSISDGRQIVGYGTLNGVARAFMLTPPTDLWLVPSGGHSQTDGNLPRGVEVGKTIRFVLYVGAPSAEGQTVFGAKLTDTLTGPAEYVGISGYDTTGEECTISGRTLTCNLPPVDSVGFGPEYLITVRATGPGKISHSAVVTSPIVPDPNASNNTVFEENWAVALAGLTLTPSSVAGGKASSARVTLTDIAPFSNDATVRLSSSRPDIAPVPATIVVPYNTTSRAFNIVPKVVSQPTPVEISATYGMVTRTQTLTVLPPALSQLYLTPTTVIGGCGTSAGKIVLTGSAPAGGAVVPLSNTNAKASVPATVTVPAGASTQTFTVKTSYVTANATGSVSASYGGVSQSLSVTVRPIRVKTLTLSPNPATGGTAVSGTVTLECSSPSNIVLALSSSNSAVAAPVLSTITIPAGSTTGTFSVRTTKVTASTTVTIYASAYGVRKGTALTVRP